MDASLAHPPKALLPICLTESEIVTEARLRQLPKARLPMATSPCAIVTSTSELENSKAESAMAVALPQAEELRLAGPGSVTVPVPTGGIRQPGAEYAARAVSLGAGVGSQDTGTESQERPSGNKMLVVTARSTPQSHGKAMRSGLSWRYRDVRFESPVKVPAGMLEIWLSARFSNQSFESPVKKPALMLASEVDMNHSCRRLDIPAKLPGAMLTCRLALRIRYSRLQSPANVPDARDVVSLEVQLLDHTQSVVEHSHEIKPVQERTGRDPCDAASRQVQVGPP